MSDIHLGLNSKPSLKDWIDFGQKHIALPLDYKEFISYFGTGNIGDFIIVFSPFATDEHLNLWSQRDIQIKAFRYLKTKYPSEVPFKLFPEPGGLLPFGLSDNGDVLFWKTEGSPDQWTVVVNAGRDARHEEFNCNMTDFLAKLLNREIVCNIFPDDFPDDNPTFQPIPA